MEYLLPCSVQGHFGVIRYTSDFSENTIVEMLLPQQFGFFSSQTFYNCCSFHNQTFIAVLCDCPHKCDFLEV